MIVLAVGDVVAPCGCDFLENKLRSIKRQYGVDFCIVNGENSSKGNGISKESAQAIFDAGADVITTGNHAFQQRSSYDFFDENRYIIRPFNYAPSCPGRGVIIVEAGRQRVMVGNLIGNIYLDGGDNAFRAADAMLKQIDNDVKIRFIDFHAEATSEKAAMAHYLDGRISAIFGTHTHVPTADECILPKGTGFITDIGMTGPSLSVLGVVPQRAINRFMTLMPERFEISNNPVMLQGVVFDIDENSGKCIEIERIEIS
jgi:metallophosphoesterase (TIGR00282 family)